MRTEAIEALIWFSMPLVLVAFLLYFISLINQKVSIKRYLIAAFLAGFLGALFVPECLCANNREALLGALFSSFVVWFGLVLCFLCGVCCHSF